MKTLTLTVIIATLTLFSCKAPSKATKTEVTEETNSETEVTSKETIYDIIVSFISKASGIDDALKTKIDTELSTFNKKHNTNIQPEIAPWGREGERDYLLITKNLSTKQQKELIATFKAAIGSSDMARLFLNEKSVHKR
jgi:hypothetical protein